MGIYSNQKRASYATVHLVLLDKSFKARGALICNSLTGEERRCDVKALVHNLVPTGHEHDRLAGFSG